MSLSCWGRQTKRKNGGGGRGTKGSRASWEALSCFYVHIRCRRRRCCCHRQPRPASSWPTSKLSGCRCRCRLANASIILLPLLLLQAASSTGPDRGLFPLLFQCLLLCFLLCFLLCLLLASPAPLALFASVSLLLPLLLSSVAFCSSVEEAVTPFLQRFLQSAFSTAPSSLTVTASAPSLYIPPLLSFSYTFCALTDVYSPSTPLISLSLAYSPLFLDLPSSVSSSLDPSSPPPMLYSCAPPFLYSSLAHSAFPSFLSSALTPSSPTSLTASNNSAPSAVSSLLLLAAACCNCLTASICAASFGRHRRHRRRRCSRSN